MKQQQLLGLLILVVVSSATCSRTLNSGVLHPATSPDTINSGVNRPALDISVQKVLSTQYTITIKNVSKEEVFCAYIPGRTGNEADYFPFITEKKTGSGEFRVLDTGGHFAPGINAIQSGKSVEFTFESFEPGTYRLRFSYLVDKEIANRLRGKVEKGFSENERNKILGAYREIASPELIID